MLANGSTMIDGFVWDAVASGPGAGRSGVRDDAVDAHAAGDVLQLMLAEVLEREFELAVHLVVDLGRDADAAWLGERLDARRDVDAVAVDPVRPRR